MKYMLQVKIKIIQVKIFYPRLILNFVCLLALIHQYETKEIENQPK